MSLPVVLTEEAEADLDEATQWYESKATGLGVEFVAEVRNTLARIADHPTIFRIVRGLIRRSQVARFPYGVFFRERDDRIEVIAVLHNRRDPSNWQERA